MLLCIVLVMLYYRSYSSLSKDCLKDDEEDNGIEFFATARPHSLAESNVIYLG